LEQRLEDQEKERQERKQQLMRLWQIWKKGREEEKTGEEANGRIWQKGYRQWSYL
jgi:hypothetical protein